MTPDRQDHLDASSRANRSAVVWVIATAVLLCATIYAEMRLHLSGWIVGPALAIAGFCCSRADRHLDTAAFHNQKAHNTLNRRSR